MHGASGQVAVRRPYVGTDRDLAESLQAPSAGACRAHGDAAAPQYRCRGTPAGAVAGLANTDGRPRRCTGHRGYPQSAVPGAGAVVREVGTS